MNAGMKNGINLLMILVLFISCVQEKEDDNVLSRVEACMELFPDSALSLLSQIDCPECLRGQQRADYALLLTQALDKNYLDSLQSDSLIMIAVEYYKQEGDKLKAGKAYFYYGKVMLLKERFSDAMQAYLEASSLLEETRDYKVQGMVWEYIGYLNSVQGLYENSIDNFKHSIRYYELASDRRRILYGYRNMARGYFSVHHNDSAGWYAEKGLVLSDTVSGMKASFLHLLGLIANNEKRYPQAIEYFSNAMEVCDNLNDKYRYSLSLGRVYSEVGQKKKAEDCFVSCINATNIFVSSGAYYYLADMHKKDGNYLKAFLYKEKSDSLLEVTRNAELQKQLLDLQNKYENDKLILENKQIRLENEKQTYFYLFLFVFILGLGIIAFFLVRKRYRTKLLRNVEIIGNNNAIINRYACRIAELENVSLQERQAKQEEIGILNRKILCLIAENKRVCENSSVDALFVLEELKQNLIISNMTIAERQHIFDFLDLVHANFITRLKQEFDLTKNELLLAALLKVGFSNKQLMIVFDCEMKSIYKNRQRLKADLGLTKNDSLEQMIMMY
ncbi:tetratricopeptide repeat protein [Bacteroides uniformis]|nr:tetratricopeptide repeat protein [Bacteroides uniformis]